MICTTVKMINARRLVSAQDSSKRHCKPRLKAMTVRTLVTTLVAFLATLAIAREKRTHGHIQSEDGLRGLEAMDKGAGSMIRLRMMTNKAQSRICARKEIHERPQARFRIS